MTRYKSKYKFYVSRVRIVTPRCFLYIAVQVHVENHARWPINNKISHFVVTPHGGQREKERALWCASQ